MADIMNRAASLGSFDALNPRVPCKRKAFSVTTHKATENGFSGVRIADRIRKTVPCGRASNRRGSTAVHGPSSRVDTATADGQSDNGNRM